MTPEQLNTVLEILLNPHTLIPKQMSIDNYGSGTVRFEEEMLLPNSLIFQTSFVYIKERMCDGHYEDNESIINFKLWFWDGDEDCYQIDLSASQERRVKYLLIDGYYDELG